MTRPMPPERAFREIPEEVKQRAFIAAGKIQIHLARAQREPCHIIIDEFFEESARLTAEHAREHAAILASKANDKRYRHRVLQRHLATLDGLSVRTLNLLECQFNPPVLRVTDAMKLSDEQLLSAKNLGELTLREIDAALARVGVVRECRKQDE